MITWAKTIEKPTDIYEVPILCDRKEEIIRQWYVKGKTILDVGCGEGDFVARFNERKIGINI